MPAHSISEVTQHYGQIVGEDLLSAHTEHSPIDGLQWYRDSDSWGKLGSKMPDIWFPFVTMLLGMVIGASIMYLSIRIPETQKWKQQEKDRLAEGRRAALRQLSAWIDPIDLAVGWAVAKAGSPDEHWPHLLTDIARLELHPGDHFLLPEGIHVVPLLVIEKLDEIQGLGFVCGEAGEHNPQLQEELISKLNDVRELAAQFRKKLTEEYIATYE
jgi:hypothetical protein